MISVGSKAPYRPEDYHFLRQSSSRGRLEATQGIRGWGYDLAVLACLLACGIMLWVLLWAFS